MAPWLEASLAKYGWIWIGLTFGFMAKYALQLKKGVKVRLSMVAADMLILPMVGLISYTIASRTGATAEPSAVIAGVCMVCADRLIKLYTERFMQRVEAATYRDTTREILESRGELRNVVQTVRSARELTDMDGGGI